MVRNVLGALGMALALPGSVLAQDTEWNRYTLEGLGGVYVDMSANQTCETAGASASSMQADATLLLIEGGVDLLTMEEMLENIALPELKVTLECVQGRGAGASGVLAYSVSVRVQQAAQMLRDSQVSLPEAVTWYSENLGVVATSDAVTALQGAVTQQLEAFAVAYSAANTSDGGSE